MNVMTEVAVKVSRLIKAPRERVFAAWTDPEDIKKWFGPETCQVLSAKTDVRVGGAYKFRVKSGSCAGASDKGEIPELEVTGIYKEVKRPSRLVFTWAWSGSPELEFGESVVTVDFLDKEGFTEVQITHERLPNKEARESHQHGWNGCLDKLEKFAAAANNGGSCSQPGAFCWNELLAADVPVATKFYTQLFGWKTEAFPGGMPYTMFTQGDQKVGGMMKKQHEQAPPQWLAYVEVENVDQSAKRAGDLGGKILMPPTDIPTVGRIAVFQDPQGASLGIFQTARK